MTKSQPLNLIQKILSDHVIGEGPVDTGSTICVKVDWVLSSELSWLALNSAHDQLGKPGLFNKDRFWLAADHIVDPRINGFGKAKMMIETAERGVKELGITNYNPPNVTIMHTEFYRQKSQPGMLVIGADSHTCSSGALGVLAVGLGTTDVSFPMVTGETFFQVPEVLRVEITGKPAFGVSGKDIILHMLMTFKRNTIAAGRAVEYGGPGLQYMSCDARFAVANMSTEFGALSGVFVPDQQTAAFINRRPNPKFKNESVYFKPDEGAQYAQVVTIDLGDVVPYFAIYPEPDNVVPVTEVTGMQLDGCFIGACTTAEEDLIMAALVLRAGLLSGLKPVEGKKRRVTPGSLSIIAQLKKLGLLEWYERAGFTVGAPGCSYCVGMGADQAGDGEVWISSQNRNFKNRMGPGSIGNLASAATVAASSFSMTVTDPSELLRRVDREYFDKVRPYWVENLESVMYSEPREQVLTPVTRHKAYSREISHLPSLIRSKVQRFGDDVDTDAITPIDICTGTAEEMGRGAFKYVRPDFVKKVSQGFRIVVAERGFGSGSSRETAPVALKAAGIQAVIAKSFAYIYNRNQANIALFGVKVTDQDFYDMVDEGTEVEVLVNEQKVAVNGRMFPFKIDAIEMTLQKSGGLVNRWHRDGKDIFKVLQEDSDKLSGCGSGKLDNCNSQEGLVW